MLRIAVCDDEEDAIDFTKQELKRIETSLHCEMEIFEYTDGMTLLNDIVKKNIEVVLLDIDMPDVTGMDIANRIVEEQPFINVIFLTNHADLVFQSLKYRPLRFIRKNVMSEELEEAIDAAMRKIESEMFLVSFERDKAKQKYAIRDIIYIESNLHYIHIHTEKGIYRVRGKISDCENKLRDYGFIRVHIGYLVNIRYIAGFEQERIILDNQERIPMSRKNAEDIKIQYTRGIGRFINGSRI